MSELDDFLSWGAHVNDPNNAGRRNRHGWLWGQSSSPKFPYGEIAGWIADYRYAQSQGEA